MNKFFDYATPESVGISSGWIINFLDRLKAQELPLHSAIIIRQGKICAEAYYAPYTADTLHRMFSITKSFVSMAIGLLEAEGKISLDDHIVDYFPEKQPENGPYKYTSMMTIRDMLAMTTCHNKTTYKSPGVTDWVGSFFTVPPTHVPGTNFSYDTSSTHTLGALVEKLTGMELLDYLRSRCLDEIGFSKDAYILKDPNGVSLGGSGLCATPMDILKFIVLIANDGKWNGKQLLPAQYVRNARSKHSDPYAKQGTLEELQGYGYQIWLTRNGGYVLFGMGGQLALYVPDKDIFMVTTADAQGRQGGVQLIYDAFWDEIYAKIDENALNYNSNKENASACNSLEENPEAYSRLQEYCKNCRLLSMPGEKSSGIINKINDVTYICDENSCGVSKISVHFDEAASIAAPATASGSLHYTNATGSHTLDFKIGDNAVGIFPDYNMRYAASGAWRMSGTFLIKVQIIDSSVGNIYISLNFKNDYITVMFRKIEESLFKEYDGVFSGFAEHSDFLCD